MQQMGQIGRPWAALCGQAGRERATGARPTGSDGRAAGGLPPPTGGLCQGLIVLLFEALSMIINNT
jgi:hypothetical protein